MNCPRRLVAGERSGVAADAGALGDGVAEGLEDRGLSGGIHSDPESGYEGSHEQEPL